MYAQLIQVIQSYIPAYIFFQQESNIRYFLIYDIYSKPDVQKSMYTLMNTDQNNYINQENK